MHVTWARFETADVNDVRLLPGGSGRRLASSDANGNTPPLLLVLGYTKGVQVWMLPSTGECIEVLSWRQGSVKTLRILPTPDPESHGAFGGTDSFPHVRPLIAMADSTGPGLAYSSASFISLKTGEQIHSIKFNSEIADLCSNRRVVVATFKEKLAVFDACNFEARWVEVTLSPLLEKNQMAVRSQAAFLRSCLVSHSNSRVDGHLS